ncbi:MAG: hypothetical protein ACP5NW_00745 [Candidatus Woesearchaeota archaeon]
MSKSDDVVSNLQRVFYKEAEDIRKNSMHVTRQYNSDGKKKGIILNQAKTPNNENIEADVSNINLKYENYELLTELYNSLNDRNQRLAHNWIINNIRNSNINIYSASGNKYGSDVTLYLAFTFMYKHNMLNDLESAVYDRVIKDLSCEYIILAIKDLLKYEHYNMSVEDLKFFERLTQKIFHPKHIIVKIRDKINNTINGADPNFVYKDETIIHNMINEIGILRLKASLSNKTEELVLEERKSLINYAKKYNLRTEVLTKLDKVDVYYKSTNEDAFDLPLQLHSLTDVFNQYIKQCQEVITQNTGEKPAYKQGSSPEKIMQEFVYTKLEFTDKEISILHSLNGYLGNDKHKNTGKKDSYRFARNMTVICINFIFQRLEGKFK